LTLRHVIPNWELRSYFRYLLGYLLKTSDFRDGGELMSYGPGALCVNVLIHQRLTQDAASEALSPRERHPVCVRALSGVCPVML
jgi:hypothetical protein